MQAQGVRTTAIGFAAFVKQRWCRDIQVALTQDSRASAGMTSRQLPATRHTAYSHPFTTPAIDHARAHGLREGPTVHASHTRGPHTMPREHASAFSLRCRNARPSATRLATADGGALCNRMHRPPAPHSQRPSTRSACAPPLPAVGPLGAHIAGPPDCSVPHIPASSRKP